jgi:hypothetical protein
MPPPRSHGLQFRVHEIQPADGARRHEGARRDADEGVDQVPDGIQAGNLVGEEFDEIQQCRRRQHPGRGQHGHAVRQRDHTEGIQPAQDQHGGIQV